MATGRHSNPPAYEYDSSPQTYHNSSNFDLQNANDGANQHELSQLGSNPRNPNKTRKTYPVPGGGTACQFAGAIIALTTIVVAAVVGAPLGATLVKQDRFVRDCEERCSYYGGPIVPSNPSSTCTPTTDGSGSLTNYSVPAPSTISTLLLACPTIDQLIYTSPTFDQAFQYNCSVDMRAGYPAVGNGTISDLLTIITYRVEDCIDACASMNDDVHENTCQGITWRANLMEEVQKNGGNCWLKSGALDASKRSGLVDGSAGDGLVSAILKQ